MSANSYNSKRTSSIFHRLINAFIIFVLILVFSLGDALPILASNDTTPPTVKSISFDKTTVQPGENLLIQVEAEDLESGIGETSSDAIVMLEMPTGNVSGFIYLTFNPATKMYESIYTVPSNIRSGTWSLDYIYIQDKAGNSFSLSPKQGDQFYKTFEVVNGSVDVTPPTVKSISFDKTIVQPGENVLIQVEAEDLESGIGETPSDAIVMLEMPTGNLSGFIYLTYNTTTKKYESIYTVPSNIRSGTWSLDYIFIQDKAGNSFSLSPKQGDQFYKTFEVADNTIRPSYLKDIQLDSTHVKAGEPISVYLTMSDNSHEEVESVSITFSSSTGRQSLTGSSRIIDENGRYSYTFYTNPYSELGEWRIESIWISSKAGNGQFLKSEDLQKYSTTFEVTKGIQIPDIEAPQIKSIELSETNVKKGGQITINVTATDNAAGVRDVMVVITSPTAKYRNEVGFRYIAESGKYSYSLPIEEGSELGSWKIESIWIRDNAGNAQRYMLEESPEYMTTFNVMESTKAPNTDIQQPGRDDSVLIPSPVQSSPSNSENVLIDVVSGNELLVQTLIKRITGVNGRVRDEATFSLENVLESISKLGDVSNKVTRIVIPDAQDKVSETTVNVPKNAMSALETSKSSLEVEIESIRLYIPVKSIQGFEKDLYFQLTPVKDENEQRQIQERAKLEDSIIAITGNNLSTIKVLGRPMTIETNMQNRPVILNIPIEQYLPKNEIERKELLKNLVVFIEHSDGTKEVIRGEVVDFKKGQLGIQFLVNNFSTFTILNMEGVQEYFNTQNCGQESSSLKAIGCLEIKKTVPVYKQENNRLKKIDHLKVDDLRPVYGIISPMLGLGGDIWIEHTNAIYYETPSKEMLIKNAQIDSNRSRIMWKGLELKSGQIGKITLLQDTVVWETINKTKQLTRVLKKGEQYRVYRYVPSIYDIGNGQYVVKDPQVIFQQID